MSGNGSSSPANDTSISELALVFAPVLVAEILVGLLSNALLIGLLVKASSVNGQNNVNVYLYSMAANNLLSLYPVTTLLVTTATKKWVFGQVACSINLFITYLVYTAQFIIHMCISRERYRAVVRFSEWQPFTRRTYLYVAGVWVFSLFSGSTGVIQGWAMSYEDDPLSCFVAGWWFGLRNLLPLFVLYVTSMFSFCIFSVAFSVLHYAYTFRRLYDMRRSNSNVGARARAEEKEKERGGRPQQRHCYREGDAPVSWEAEVRSLKSAACLFFVLMVPIAIGELYVVTVGAVAVTEGKPFRSVNVPLVHVGVVTTYSLSCVGPALLLAVNGKFRTRVRDLFRWKLRPIVTLNESGISSSSS